MVTILIKIFAFNVNNASVEDFQKAFKMIVSFVKLKTSYKANNFMLCKQSSRDVFHYIFDINSIELKWMWQTPWTVFLRLKTNQLNWMFTFVLRYCLLPNILSEILTESRPGQSVILVEKFILTQSEKKKT